MKGIAKCPKCGKTITTNCRGCIEGETYTHTNKKGEPEIIEKVNWKKVPENEKELKEVEEEL